jgi:hypothetical protein
MRIGPDGVLWFSSGTNFYRATTHATFVGKLPRALDGILMLPDGTLLLNAHKLVWRAGFGPLGMQLTTLIENVRGFGGMRSAVTIDRSMHATHRFLDTGESITRDSTSVTAAAVNDDVIALYVAGSEPRIDIYENRVPQDPRQLHAWIDSATNAVLKPGSDDLTWR